MRDREAAEQRASELEQASEDAQARIDAAAAEAEEMRALKELADEAASAKDGEAKAALARVAQVEGESRAILQEMQGQREQCRKAQEALQQLAGL